jgi:hypothetical protein
MPHVYAPARPLLSHLLPALAALLLLLAAGPAHAQIAPGTYTVGSSGDYPSLSAAISDVETQGIDDSGTGAVELALMAGTFEEGGLTLGAVTGSSTDRPLVVRSQEDDASSVTLQHTATDDTDNHILRLDGAQHVRLEALTWAPKNPDYARAITLSGTTEDIEISDNVFNGVGTDPFDDFRDERYALIDDVDWEPQDALRLDGNTFTQGSYGFLMAPSFGADPFPSVEATGNTFDSQRVAGIKVEEATGAHVDGNTITTVTAGGSVNSGFGIEIRETDAPEITGNTVDLQANTSTNRTGIVVNLSPDAQITGNTVTVEGTGGNPFSGQGIIVGGFSGLNPTIADNVVSVSGGFSQRVGMNCNCSGVARVMRNRITLDAPFGSGIGLVVSETGSGDGGLIANNQVALNAALSTSPSVGVRINGSNQRLYHNSVRVGRRGNALSIDNIASDIDVRNNVLAVVGDGLALGTGDGAGVTSDYNALYVPTAPLASWNGASVATLADLQALGTDANSTDVYPAFASATDLSTRSYYIDDEGTDLTADVPADIDGTARTAPPSLGAYQIDNPIQPLPPGTYTVGSTSADFPDPDSALTALLAGGIEPSASAAAQAGKTDGMDVILEHEPGTYSGNHWVPEIPGAMLEYGATFTSTTDTPTDVTFTHSAESLAEDYVFSLSGADFVKFRGITMHADGDGFSRVLQGQGAIEDLHIDNCNVQSVGGVDGQSQFEAQDRGAAMSLDLNGRFEIELQDSELSSQNGDVAVKIATSGAPINEPPTFDFTDGAIDAPAGDGMNVDMTDENGDLAGEATVDDTEINSQDRALLVEAATLIIRDALLLGFEGLDLEVSVSIAIQRMLLRASFGGLLSAGTEEATIDVSNSVLDITGSGNGSNAESAAKRAPRTSAMQIQGDVDFSFTTFKLPGAPLGVQVNNRALHATNSLFDGLDGLNLGMDNISSIDLSGTVADVPEGLTVFLNGSEVPAEDVVADSGGTVADVMLNEEGQAAKSTALTVENPDPGTLLDVNGNVREDVDPTTPGSQTPVGAFGTFFDGAIPVELTAFTAHTDGRAAVLSWQTASETNNAGFRVERRTDDTGPWTRMGFVESRADGGTSAEPLTYRFRAEGLDVGTHAFRLVQTDLDGSTTPSDPVEVRIGLDAAFALSAVSPNPIRGRGTVEVAVREAQAVTAHLYDVMGRRVQVLHDGPLAEQTTHRLAVDARGLSSGIYFVRMIGEGFTASRKVVVVR